MAEMHDATEEYLEAILEIEEDGVVPMRARLVERLGLSAAAVSEQVGRLTENGYTTLLPDRSIELTHKGRTLAISVVRRHRLAERLLVDVIGLEWEKAHREADRWEHAISAEVEEKLVELLGDPATCPHGNPIPGTKQPRSTAPVAALSEVPSGTVQITRVSEKLEIDDDAMHLLGAARVIPGTEAEVVASLDTGVRVRNTNGEVEIPTTIASMVFVTVPA